VKRIAVLALLVLTGCTALQQMAALRHCTFAFANVSDVRVAGIAIGPDARVGSLGLADATRLGAALLANQVPIELVAHVSATNPAENKVAARMVHLDWRLFVEDRQALAGTLDDAVSIPHGHTTDVPLAVRFDLLQLTSGSARDLYDVALAIAGQGTVKKDLRLELVPTVETALGPIRYPSALVVRRSVP
jgi:hypothetical protein